MAFLFIRSAEWWRVSTAHKWRGELTVRSVRCGRSHQRVAFYQIVERARCEKCFEKGKCEALALCSTTMRIMQTESGAFSFAIATVSQPLLSFFAFFLFGEWKTFFAVHYLSRRSARVASIMCSLCVCVCLGEWIRGQQWRSMCRCRMLMLFAPHRLPNSCTCHILEAQRLGPLSMMFIRFDAQRRNQRIDSHVLRNTGCGNRQPIKSFKMSSTSFIAYKMSYSGYIRCLGRPTESKRKSWQRRQRRG